MLSGRVPENLIPISTHKQLVRFVVMSSGILLISGLAILKVLSSENVLAGIAKLFIGQ